MSARKQRSYKGRVACREDVIFGECARRTTSRLSKRKEAPHDGLQPSGCDGAMLSEKAQTRQEGFIVNIQREPTRHATDTSDRRKCFSGDEGRLTSKMPHDGWRHHDTLFSLDNVHTDVMGSIHRDVFTRILLHRDLTKNCENDGCNQKISGLF